MVHTEAGLAGPDIELIFAPVPFLDHGFTEPPGHGFTIGVDPVAAAQHRRITLASADPAVAPHIDPAYLTDDADVQTLVAGCRSPREILARPGARRACRRADAPRPLSRSTTARSESFVRQYAETLYHPVGTCRMGADEASVVDPDLRVRAWPGCGSSTRPVMPRIIRGHTNAPTLMIAEKAADLITA